MKGYRIIIWLVLGRHVVSLEFSETYYETKILLDQAYNVLETAKDIRTPLNCAMQCEYANCSAFSLKTGSCSFLVEKERSYFLRSKVGESVFSKYPVDAGPRLYIPCINQTYHYDFQLLTKKGRGHPTWLKKDHDSKYMGIYGNGFVTCHMQHRRCLYMEIGATILANAPQNPPHVRSGFALTYLSSTRVFISGHNSAPRSQTSDIWNTGTWSTGPDLPREFFKHCGIALDRDRALLIGGEINGVIVGSTSEHSWATMQWTEKGNLRVPRAGHGGAKFTDEAGITRVLICGGTSDFTTVLRSCESYDESTQAWTLENTIQLIEGRMFPQWIVYGSHVLVLGGHLDVNDETDVSLVVERFEASNQTLVNWMTLVCQIASPIIVYNV